MSKLAEYRKLEKYLAEQLQALEALKSDGALKKEIEFETKLRLNSTHKCNAHPCMHFVRRLPAQALARA